MKKVYADNYLSCGRIPELNMRSKSGFEDVNYNQPVGQPKYVIRFHQNYGWLHHKSVNSTFEINRTEIGHDKHKFVAFSPNIWA